MTQEDWQAGYAQSLAAFLNGEAISEPDPRGGRIVDAKFLLLFNAHSDPITFTLPEASLAAGWEVVIDTAHRGGQRRGGRSHPDAEERNRGRRPGRRRAAVRGLIMRQIFAAAPARRRRPGRRCTPTPPGRGCAPTWSPASTARPASTASPTGLSSTADRRLFALLRTLADVIVVGAATVRAEKLRAGAPARAMAGPAAGPAADPADRGDHRAGWTSTRPAA